MNKLFLVVLLSLSLFGCSINPRTGVQVLTFEYVGGDCSSAARDISGLKVYKSWMDLRNISLQDAKSLFLARVYASDKPDYRKSQIALMVASIEVRDELGVLDENSIYLTASEYIDYVIEAYSIACPSAV